MRAREADDRPRTLILLRHAKATHHGGLSDEERALTSTGRRQARDVGHALVAAGLVPDRVLCSTAARTRETFDNVAAAFTWPPAVDYSEDLYDSGVTGSLEVIAGAPAGVRTLLVIGHEPVMSGISYFLAGPGSAPGPLGRVRAGMPTGAYGVVRLDVAWDSLGRGAGRLVSVYEPPHHLLG